MSDVKEKSNKDGTQFLQDAFALEQQLLGVKLAFSTESITHSASKGEVNESHFIGVLRRYLPNRYAVDRGIAIDSTGATSDQLDVVIYDRQYTPVLMDQESHRYIPAEAIYAVLEAKPAINKDTLEYAGDKLESVRRLVRTSVPIVHSDGTHDPKELFNIVGGIVATEVSWADGFQAEAFQKAFASLEGERQLDCGLAVNGGSFDLFEDGMTLGPENNGLVFFLFRLLKKLQELGTVPAVDWSAYAAAISTITEEL
ncbi:MAG: hypothetical protein N0E56_15910 [Candidatus Thiodiazotropha endolucinida]|nr:hypothetical protein [Candidatus Thiodiazotropha taylori]MCW4268109.1 hypothetical protein [Candidatus Thiodiazotropha endolucinida]